MFETVQLGQTMSKADFAQAETRLRQQLLVAQAALARNNTPVIVVVSGVDGAGKGDVVDRLHKWLDTRGVQTLAFWDTTDEQEERPYYWRFWRGLPPRGHIAIYFNAWYWEALHLRARRKITEDEFDDRMRRASEFECMLQADGYLIVKLWFHIDKKLQKQRLKKRKEMLARIQPLQPDRLWQKKYKKFVAAAERAIRLTDHEQCPWVLIEATEANHRDAKAGEALLAAMHRHLERTDDTSGGRATAATRPTSERAGPTVLDRIDLAQRVEKSHYEDELRHYQRQLEVLAWEAYALKRSTVLVFEGWDASGKGGGMRRITDALDARLYRAITTGPPSDEELAHHYLWRFWRHIPRAGYMTLYDRSWYGRVLVERVEGLAATGQWNRAYEEINNFEEQLIDHGVIVLKYWLHISPEEQLRRFHARESVPWKRYKITEDDWRNRERWEDYARAVNDMIAHTSTAKAPWHLIAAQDKRYARIEVVRKLCDALEKQLH